MAACGGSDGSRGPGGGASGDASVDAPSIDGATRDGASADGSPRDGEAMRDGATDGAPTLPSDAGSDATPWDGAATCGATNGGPCSMGGSRGLCRSGTCAACTPATDDAACTAAFGGSSNPYLCVAGACVPGNCRTDANCPSGEICGATTANTCGPCAVDSQCIADPNYGVGTICHTSSGAGNGTCVSGACTSVQMNASCPANAADICCATGASQGCVTGNCCTDAQCAGTPSTPYCVGNSCRTCDEVGSPWTYIVDPVNGSDAPFSTGSGLVGGAAHPECAFKTIAHAVQAIVAAQGTAKVGTRVVVHGAAVSTATGEAFPISVPANVTIAGDGSGAGALTVAVPSSTVGFRLAAVNSGLSTMTVDGNGVGFNGVLATTGSSASTSIAAVIVQNFDDSGIRVDGSGVLTIAGGSQSNGNGANVATHPGLYVTDAGTAIITGGTNAAPTAFNNNGDDGISVDSSGSVSIIGTAGTTGNGTVVLNGNAASGIAIRQALTGTAPLNAIDGVAIWNSGTSGITVYSGSRLKLRNSVVLGSGNSGVLVVNNPSASSVSVSGVDLGNSVGSDWGKNVLQATGGNRNADSGVCLSVPSGAGASLLAAGNTFGATDCSAVAGVLTRTACTTGIGSDVGLVNATGNAIVTSQCSYP